MTMLICCPVFPPATEHAHPDRRSLFNCSSSHPREHVKQIPFSLAGVLNTDMCKYIACLLDATLSLFFFVTLLECSLIVFLAGDDNFNFLIHVFLYGATSTPRDEIPVWPYKYTFIFMCPLLTIKEITQDS
jgi:hypothetical protein